MAVAARCYLTANNGKTTTLATIATAYTGWTAILAGNTTPVVGDLLVAVALVTASGETITQTGTGAWTIPASNSNAGTGPFTSALAYRQYTAGDAAPTWHWTSATSYAYFMLALYSTTGGTVSFDAEGTVNVVTTAASIITPNTASALTSRDAALVVNAARYTASQATAISMTTPCSGFSVTGAMGGYGGASTGIANDVSMFLKAGPVGTGTITPGNQTFNEAVGCNAYTLLVRETLPVTALAVTTTKPAPAVVTPVPAATLAVTTSIVTPALPQAETSPGLEVYGFTITGPGSSDTIEWVQVSVTEYQSNATQAACSIALWDGTSAQIGATQTGTASTSTGNVSTATFTGVTYAQLATLRVRIYGNAMSGTGYIESVDGVGLTVCYSPYSAAQDATVTLGSALAVTTTQPAPAVVTPVPAATLAVTVTEPAPGVSGSLTAGILAAAAALPAAAAISGSIALGSVLAVTTAQPAPAAISGSITLGSALAATTSIVTPAVTASGNATVTPATVTVATAVPPPVVRQDQTITALVTTVTAAQPPPAAISGTLTAAALAATTSQPAVTTGVSASFTVSAAITNLGTALGVKVFVVTGAQEAGGSNAGSAGTYGVTNVSLTPASTGSLILFGLAQSDAAWTAYTAAASNTLTDNLREGVTGAGYGDGYYSGTVTGGTPVTVGAATVAEWNATGAYELIPSSGTTTPLIDASTPAIAHGTAAPQVTASFTPPSGSVLAAVVMGDATAASAVTVTDTSGLGLTWTQRALYQASYEGLVAIYTATVPATGSATVTPAVLAVTTAQPAPVVRQDQTVTPATLAVTTGKPAPGVSGGLTASVLACPATEPAPGVSGGLTASALAVTTSKPAPSAISGTLALPAALAVATAQPPPAAVSGGLAAGTLAVTTVIVTPTVTTAGNATVTLGSALAVTASVPFSAAGASVSVTLLAGDIIVVTTAQPAVTVATGTIITPATLTVTTAVPAPVVRQDQTVTASTLAVTTSKPAPVVRQDQTIAASTVAVTTAKPAPAAISGGLTVSALAAAALFPVAYAVTGDPRGAPFTRSLLFGAQIGAWDMNGGTAVSNATAIANVEAAGIQVIRWQMWETPCDIRGTACQTTSDFLAGVNGIIALGAIPLIGFPPIVNTQYAGQADPWSLAWQKWIIDKCVPLGVTLFEMGNEPDIYGSLTGQQYHDQLWVNAPVLKAYARSTYATEIYIGGPAWGNSATANLADIETWLAGCKADYLANGNSRDYLPDFVSTHCYLADGTQNDTQAHATTAINAWGTFYDSLRTWIDTEFAGLYDRGYPVARELLIADSEYNDTITQASTINTSQAWTDFYFTAMHAMHAAADPDGNQRVWLAVQFTICSNNGAMDLLSYPAGTANPEYNSFKALSAGAATIFPATVAAATAQPAPAAISGSLTAATLAASTSIITPAVTTAGNATVLPATVTMTTAVPAPVVRQDRTVTAATVAVPAAAPAPGVSGGLTASTLAVTSTQPAPVVRQDATATPATLAVTAAVPAVTATGGANPAPPSDVATATFPAVAASGSATASPAAVTVAAAIVTPSVTASGNATVTAVILSVSAAIPAPVVRQDQAVTPAAVAAATSVPVPAVAGSAATTPATLAASTAVPAPAVSCGATATPGTVAAAATVPAVQASAGSTLTLATLSVAITAPAPSVSTASGVTVAAVTVTALFTIPQPTVRQDRTVPAVTVTATALFPVPDVAAITGITGTVLWTASPYHPRWQAAPAPPRWHATPAPPRWKATLMSFAPIAAISLEEVNVLWTSMLAGTEIDPTGQTANQMELSVQFAFPQSSGNPQAPAEPTTWFTGSWLTGTNIAGYIAQALVGPGGGAVTLTAGLQYDVWGKVEGTPETPARYAGTLPVY